jgi:hypothetical protein
MADAQGAQNHEPAKKPFPGSAAKNFGASKFCPATITQDSTLKATLRRASQLILRRGPHKIGSFDNTDEILWSIAAGSVRQANALKPEKPAGHPSPESQA